MTLRNQVMRMLNQGLRARRVLMLLPPFGLALFCLYLALSPTTELWAQAPGQEMRMRIPPPGTFQVTGPVTPRLARPVPVQNLVTFETAFVQRLNEAIRNPEALKAGRPKVVVLVDTKVFRGVVDTRAVVVVESATTVALNTAQIQELRDTLLRQVDNAVRSELAGRGGLRQLGSGVVLDDVVVANLKPVAN
jgi:hypothetical protein